LVSEVEEERARTEGGVEAAVGVAKERIPANCCVPDAGGEVEKGVLPFRGIEPGIASVRWRDNRLRFRSDSQAEECEHREN